MPQPWLEAAQVLDGSAAAPHLSVRTTPLAPRDAAHLGLAATVPPAPSGQGPLLSLIHI